MVFLMPEQIFNLNTQHPVVFTVKTLLTVVQIQMQL